MLERSLWYLFSMHVVSRKKYRNTAGYGVIVGYYNSRNNKSIRKVLYKQKRTKEMRNLHDGNILKSLVSDA